MSDDAEKTHLLEMTADIVSAFLGKNETAPGAVPALIADVHQALETALNGAPAVPLQAPIPAVPIEKSVHDDYIICLEDGAKFKSLKRHLRTKFDLTPKAYRDKWGLPADYPMVAPSYSRKRSSLAKRSGLGKS